MSNVFDVVITTFGEILSILIIADALLSFILPPYHPIREALGRILNPLYAPIRKILPAPGGFDFSPIILLLLVQFLVRLLTSIV